MFISESMYKGFRVKWFFQVMSLVSVLFLPVAAIGGSLEAPTGPDAQGDRHTLQHIYGLLKSGTPGTALSGAFSGPTALGTTIPTTPSGNTLNDIYDAAPQPDANGNGSDTTEVCETKTFWSLRSGSWGGPQTGARNCNTRPVASDGSQTVTESNANTGINLDSLIFDSETADSGLTISLGASGDGNFTLNTRTVTYNPNNKFNYLASGQSAYDYFTFTVNDNTGKPNATDTATVIITVTGVDSAPTLSGSIPNPYMTISEDSAGSGNVKNFPVTRVDKDVAALTYQIGTSPGNGAVTLISSTNAFMYVPNANFNGTDSFSFRACNGAYCTGYQILNITVTAVNDPPSFDLSTQNVTTTGAGAKTVTGFATNRVMGPSDESSQAVSAFTVTTVSDPSNVVTGTPTIDPSGGNTGRLNYTASANTGTALFKVTMTDNGGGNATSSEQWFMITVN